MRDDQKRGEHPGFAGGGAGARQRSGLIWSAVGRSDAGIPGIGQNGVMNSVAPVPSYYDLLWPTLQAVIAIDGSGHLSEINSAVVEREDFSEEQQSVLHGDGPQTEIEYRLAWART